MTFAFTQRDRKAYRELLTILHMDAPPDEALTSDADEREILEATHSDLYWDRVVSRRPLKLLLPTNSMTDHGDDM